jgi:hypothetical protein
MSEKGEDLYFFDALDTSLDMETASHGSPLPTTTSASTVFYNQKYVSMSARDTVAKIGSDTKDLMPEVDHQGDFISMSTSKGG